MKPKKKQQISIWLHTEIIPVASIAKQSFLQCFEGCQTLFAAFQNVYLYTPQLLAKPLRTFYETLVGLHCNEITCLSRTHSLHFQQSFQEIHTD
jgi:hypothetical protein